MDDESETFLATHEIGREITIGTSITAYLVERIVLNETFPQGNRTSILSYEINPSFTGNVTIICNGVGEENMCSQTVYVIGGKSLLYDVKK